MKPFDLDFSTLETPREEAFTWKDKTYLLREASAGAAAKYRSTQAESMILGPDGKPTGIKGVGEVQPLLVALCTVDEKGRAVSVATVKSWPDRMVSRLFTIVKEISELDETEEDEDAVKNESEDITSA